MTRLSDIGPDLVRLRRARGMTQSALADLLGVKRQQVQRWEKAGYRTAAFESVARVAAALGWEPAAGDSLSAETPAAYGPTSLVEPVAAAPAPVRDLGEIVARVRAHAGELHERYGVTYVGVFGSFARGEQRPDSDVDLIVEVERPTMETTIGPQEDLSEVLGRKADCGALETLRPRLRRYVAREIVDVWRA